jgi:hypothetical protein
LRRFCEHWGCRIGMTWQEWPLSVGLSKSSKRDYEQAT